jgi:D-alanyl-D-alanine carboxypeptidase/D-alanyl-D-alanine-endopeptidase (penicillin-binding protein 4)
MRRALLVALLVPCAAAAQVPQPVQAALDRARVPASAASIVVAPADPGPPLVTHNALAALNPASVMKVVTAYAALDLLGPAFTFRTDVLVSGELANGVLSGDLHVRGGGDPKLTYERLWQVMRQLRARGLREIRGDIVIDRGYFSLPAHDAGRFDQEPRRAYNVGPDPLLVNYGVVDFRFVPEGSGVRVVPVPDLPSLEVASRIELTLEPCGSWRSPLKYDVTENGLLATVVFSGRYSADCGERSWPLAVLEPTRFTEALLRWTWSEAGGVLRGKVREGPAPLEARLLHRHESEPLASLVREMNKHSNNVMARHLFLALSAEKAGLPGNAAASLVVLRQWLRSREVEAPELVVENGSGLSRLERASAATIAGVLRSAWQSPLMPELAASFPVWGGDGTLRTRRGDGAGRAHLKGGTLRGVNALAGYVLDRRGKRWIVVMTINHDNAQAAAPALEALVDWVRAR